MYELLIIACLANQPAKCEEFHLPFEAPTAIRVCMYRAQFRMATWVHGMPGWNIKKWTCGLPKT
ncbi:MAG: hypothetical protein OEU92_13810 [Alphaproteobacteria bacterium]|nr:hypothetical protein [Alphaproteobacteria bacterium]